MAFLHKDFYGIVQEIQAAHRENTLSASRQKLIEKYGSDIICAAYELKQGTAEQVDFCIKPECPITSEFIDWLRHTWPEHGAEIMEEAFQDLTDYTPKCGEEVPPENNGE